MTTYPSSFEGAGDAEEVVVYSFGKYGISSLIKKPIAMRSVFLNS